METTFCPAGEAGQMLVFHHLDSIMSNKTWYDMFEIFNKSLKTMQAMGLQTLVQTQYFEKT